MNKARASSQAAATSPVAGPAVKSAIHGTDTIVPVAGRRLPGRGVNALWRVLRMALGYRVRFPAAVLAVIGAGVFQLLIPRFLGRAVDHATGLLAGAHGVGATEAAQAALMTSALLVLGTAVMRGLFTLTHNYLAESIGQSFGYELRLAFFQKLQRLSFSYHDRIHSGDLITRGMLDIEGVRRFIETGIMRLFQLAVLVGLGAYLYMGQDLLLGFLCVSFVPFAVWRGTVFRLKVRALWREFQERMSVLTRIMEENLAGIRVVRAFSAQQHELDKFDDWQRRTLEPAVESRQGALLQHFHDDLLLLSRDGPGIVAGRPARDRRADHHRRADAVPGVHDGAPDAGAAGRPRYQRFCPRLRIGRTHVRDSRHRTSDPRPARRARSRGEHGATYFRERVLFLRRIPGRACGRGHFIYRLRRPDAGNRRPAGQRQIDHCPPHPAFL